MPPILVPSSAKRNATKILVIGKLNGRKDFIFTGFACDIICPNEQLPDQSYQLKHRNKVWQLFKTNNEAISNFVLIVEFVPANVCWVHIERQTLLKKIRYIMYCVVTF